MSISRVLTLWHRWLVTATACTKWCKILLKQFPTIQFSVISPNPEYSNSKHANFSK